MKPNKVVTKPSSPQIEALEKAAMEPKPFVEECEKREMKKEPKITDIYWMDETGDEIKLLSQLDEGKEVTLFVDAEGVKVDDAISLSINPPEGKLFSNKSNVMELTARVEESEKGFIGIIDNFKFEFDGSSK